MQIKSVLAHAAQDERSDRRLRAAAAVAAGFDARLIALGAQAYWPFIDPAEARGEVRRLVDLCELELRETERRFRALGLAAPAEIEWRAGIDLPHLALAEHARAADLVIASRSPGDHNSLVTAPVEDVLMHVGGPVLVLNEEGSEPSWDSVLVAWKSGAPARRAVADALPFLARATRVVVSAFAEGDDAGAVELQTQDVCDRLRRHGIAAESAVAAAHGSAGDQLLQQARSLGADLVVAGAYGHSRLQEWVLGGVTRTLLADAAQTVLFSR